MTNSPLSSTLILVNHCLRTVGLWFFAALLATTLITGLNLPIVWAPLISSIVVILSVQRFGIPWRSLIKSLVISGAIGLPLIFMTSLEEVALIPLAWVPVAEESLFRGYLQHRVSEQHGLLLAVAVSSIAFSAMHFEFDRLLFRAGLGAVLGLLYTISKSLPTVTAAHVMYNSIILIGHES